MDMLDEKYIDGNITGEGYLYAQALLDRFAEVNYETALNSVRSVADIDAAYCRGQIMDIIRNNPPLATIPKYLHDARANYLWYSDFYFDAGRKIDLQYRQFISPDTPITPASYAAELPKIDLPYFKELVNLVSLERLCAESERHIPTINPEPTSTDWVEAVVVEEPETEQPAAKRSYEPKLNKEQYTLLAECVESIRLFRRPATPAQLKKLFTGKMTEPLQVTNQLPMVYLFDKLREAGYIKKTWMTTAVENGDFISFPTPGQERRYGSKPHYLTMAQLKNRRSDMKFSYIYGEDNIDEMIEKMQKCGDK